MKNKLPNSITNWVKVKKNDLSIRKDKNAAI